jgi:hypothetical protein
MKRVLFAASALLLAARIGPAAGNELSVSPGGHNFVYRGKTVMLVGDSGTQCVMQNLNIDYRRWVSDCATRGMTAVHIWSFVAPRQRQDGSIIEKRYGYVYPGATPWKRRPGGPMAVDQLSRWDLTEFDEGDDPAKNYWPRLRDLAASARDKGMALGITVFFGWPKHAERNQNDWAFHPFHFANGGHLADNNAVQILDSPDREILDEPWSDQWPRAKKTQWIWERFADKMIRDLRPYGNVFYVFMDEHSYSEGNCGDHFLKFFKKRGALYVDWSRRRVAVDAVYVETTTSTDRNAVAVRGLDAEPARPLLLLEGPPYTPGDPDVRRSMWTFAAGGGHFILHDDQNMDPTITGIMAYDPKIPSTQRSLETYDWLGNLSRFFNEKVRDLDALSPHNELVSGGSAGYCLANPGAEYAVYLKQGGAIRLDLTAQKGKRFEVEWYDPRSGKSRPAAAVNGGQLVSLNPPEQAKEDWVVHVAGQSSKGRGEAK